MTCDTKIGSRWVGDEVRESVGIGQWNGQEPVGPLEALQTTGATGYAGRLVLNTNGATFIYPEWSATDAVFTIVGFRLS